MNLADKVIWITGASSGIGEHLSRQLGDTRARLIISARREEKLREIQSEIGEERVKILPFDLSAVENHQATAQQALAFFGQVDILILNGGISQRGEAKDTALDVDRKIMEINFFANVALAKSVLPSMLSNGFGHYMVTSSLTGKFGFKLRSAYAASKHALHGFFESLRFEESPNGIGVTMVCPGFIKTDLSLHAVTGDGKLQGSMDKNQADGMPPEECARQMIKALKSEKHEVVIGGFERNSVLIKRLFPRLHYKLVSKKDGRG